MNQDSEKTVLVFGASGIIGWGVTNNLLDFTTPTTFEHIVALTSRRLTKAQALRPHDSRLEVHSGIDLSTSVDTVTS